MFLERVNGTFQDYLETENIQSQKTLIYNVHPLVKLVCAILLIIQTNYLNTTFISHIFIILILLTTSILLQINLKRQLNMLFFIGILFPLVISLPLIFLESGNTVFSMGNTFKIIITDAGLIKARNFILRLLANTIIISFLILSTPFVHIIHVLKYLHFPRIFIVLLVLTYRYFFLLFENLVKILRADECRRFGKYPFKDRFAHIGTIFGGLLLRSIDRGTRVNQAMLTRGFTGTLPVLKFKVSMTKTIIFVIFMVLISYIYYII